MRKEREQEEALEKIVKNMNNPTPKKRTESGVIVKGIDNVINSFITLLYAST